MKGKLKVKQKASMLKWLVPAIIAVTLMSGVWLWQSQNASSFNIDGTSSLEPPRTPLSEDMRNKRVAIMVFDNKTGSDDLEDFGVMISDWITKGLMETGDANVISAANIQNKVALAGMGGENTQKFAEETGVGVLLQGRYYMQENQLIIHANVVDAEKGEVIHALETIQGDRNKLIDLLDELTDEVLGYWSVKSLSRFNKNPPKYEAYQKYRAAQVVWGQREHFDKIEKHLVEAIAIDPDFHEATLKLAVFNGNRGRNTFRRDSLLDILEKSKSELSKWERLRFEQVKASANLEHEKAAKLCEEMFAMDPSDASSNYNASVYYGRANMPQHAIDILTQMDNKYRDMEEDYSWVEPRFAAAYYVDGQYAKAIEVAQSYPFPKMVTVLAIVHIQSLVRLDSIGSIPEALLYYEDRGVYNFAGDKKDIDVLLRAICSEAYLMDKTELLDEYNQQFSEWNKSHPDTEDFHQNNGWVSFYDNDLTTAIEHIEKEELDPKSQNLLEYSVMGFLHAKLGNIDQANRYKTLITQWEERNKARKTVDKVLLARVDYCLARIDMGLGNFDSALSHLKIAQNKGYFMLPWFGWQYDVFMIDLFGNPEFQEMVRPK